MSNQIMAQHHRFVWRCSDRLACLFIEFTQIAASRCVLVVSCGLGTLAKTVEETALTIGSSG
jgi:hypothetical protein